MYPIHISYFTNSCIGYQLKNIKSSINTVAKQLKEATEDK